jgi:hypothetical protein
MRQEFYDIYREMYSRYLDAVSLGLPYMLFPHWDMHELLPATQLLKESVESQERSLPTNMRLRPDAKYFLLINIYQMAMLPLGHPDSPSRQVLKEPPRFLQEDVSMIFRESLNNAKERNRKEITGRDVSIAMTRLWDKLRLNSFDVWG